MSTVLVRTVICCIIAQVFRDFSSAEMGMPFHLYAGLGTRRPIFASLCYASAAYAVMRCPSVCLSVRPSHLSILSSVNNTKFACQHKAQNAQKPVPGSLRRSPRPTSQLGRGTSLPHSLPLDAFGVSISTSSVPTSYSLLFHVAL